MSSFMIQDPNAAVVGGSNFEMRFPVENLREKLIENKQIHEDIVAEANEGFRLELIEKIQDTIKQVKKDHRKRLLKLNEELSKVQAGEEIGSSYGLRKPDDHSSDYESIITMLSMTSEEYLVLSRDQFDCYVMDRWPWQQDFLSNASNFSCSGSMYLTNFR